MSDFDPRHPEASRPLEDVAQALKSAASSPPAGGMDPKVKGLQRANLISSMQKTIAPSSAPSNAPSTPPKQRRSLWMPTFTLAGVLAVVVIAVLVFQGNRNWILPGGAGPILIPAAHAMDAFSLTPEQSDRAGMATNSAFVLKTNVAVSADQIKKAIVVEPAIDVKVEASSKDTFRVIPTAPLATGKIYRVKLATAVTGEGGKIEGARTFSWALQTKNDFRVLSTIPGDLSSRVPTNTGIEFKMTMEKWQNPEKYFSITPKVAGRFETHGRTLVFVPSKPLAEGARYTVELKKGLSLEGSDLKLEEDRKIRFETDYPRPMDRVKPFISLSEFYEVTPAQNLDLSFSSYGEAITPSTPVEVTGYALSPAQAKALLETRTRLPGWAWAAQNQYEAYRTLQAKQAFQLTLNPIQPEKYSPFQLSIPKQSAGYYAIKLLPKDGEESWIFVQVTNVATYATGDKDQMTIWAVNADTKRPLGSLSLVSGSDKSQTNEQGLGTLPAPAFFKNPIDPGEQTAVQIIEVGSGALQSLVAVTQSGRPIYYDYGNTTDAWDTTWGYLYLDRPLYHPQDQLEFFGLAQDRASKKGIGSVKVKLTRQSYFYDYVTGEEKVYQEQTLQTDESGRFQGKMSWDALATGGYLVNIYRDDKLITKRWFEVREFVKPAYTAGLQTDAAKLFAGEPIKGTVNASFFEGTPVPKLELNLKTNFSWRYESNQFTTQELVTDINGLAHFTIPTTYPSCTSEYLGVCPQWADNVYLEATPKGGEEAEILARGDVQLFPSTVLIDTDVHTSGTAGTLRVTTYHADLSKDDAKGAAWAGRNVQIDIQAYRWVAREEGNYYDFIQKKTVPSYRYEQVWDPVITNNFVTDAGGRAVSSFTMEREKTYRIYIISSDDQGRKVSMRAWTSFGWNDYWSEPNTMPSDGPGYPNLHFLSVTSSNLNTAVDYFSLHDTAEVRFDRGDKAYDLSKTPGALFIVASRGIRKAQVQSSATFRFSFTEDLVPNADVRAVTFDGGQFVEVTGSAFLKQEDRALKVELAPEKKAFAPGETVKVRVTAKDMEGRVVSNTKVAYGAVDKALLALAYSSDETPLSSIYGYVNTGILFNHSSHYTRDPMYGGAEKGGGGMGDAPGQSPRRIFKDTASFGVIDINERGEGEIIFKAPDNITGWRLEAVGVSGNLFAGANKVDIPVTKPVFVQVVAPLRVLASDKPVIKVRAYGAALSQNTPVTFTMESPSLGVRQVVTSTGSNPVYLALSSVSAGRHTMTFRVQSSQGNDALERVMDVVATRFTKDEFVKVDAMAGATLPEIGVPEVDVYFTNQGRASLLPEIRHLAYSPYSRIDSQVASALMANTLTQEFGETLEWRVSTSSLREYQADNGGIKLLPYASTDVELTAEVAATAPALFDRATLSDYLWQELDAISTSSTARGIQIAAVSGLAALDQPVLIPLQSFADQKNLTWREQLAIARGLVAVGDQERASKMLEQLLKKSEERNGLRHLTVSEKRVDDYEATAEAAALAARLHHPDAASLKKYIDQNWHGDAFPVMAQARYIQSVLPTYKTIEANVTYKIGNEKPVTLHLKDYSKTARLTAAEAKALQVTKVDGQAEITFVRRVPGRPTNSPHVAISRTYEAAKPLDQLQEGDVVKVRLRVEFDPKAQDGCYQIHDHLPGGWEMVVNRIENERSWWYADSSMPNGEVSFGTCVGGAYPKATDRVYTARIVSRGTFTAEAPFIQHMEYTSQSAIGQDQQVIVK